MASLPTRIPPGRQAPPGSRARRAAAWAAACLLLAGVAMAYLDPHMMVELANRAWSCF